MPLPRAIIDLEEYTESVNWLIYGPSNAGKTTLVGQIPNTLILATEQGTISAARSKTRAKNVKVWEVKKWSDLEEAFLYLRDEKHPFTTVAIDSLTNMQQMLLRDILGSAYVTNPNKYDLDIPQIQDHQKWQNKLKRFITDFNSLPLNTVWTAQTMEFEDADGEEVVLPFLQGKKGEISRWACAQMHIVSYYSRTKRTKEGDEPTRRLLFDEYKGFFAKDRYGVFGKAVDMSKGSEQLESLGELMARIETAPVDTRKKAAKAVEEDEDDESATVRGVGESTKNTPIDKNSNTRKFRAVTDDSDDEEEE